MAEQLRLDQALVERGLARSRTQAQQLIAAGLVRVDGRDVRKASAKVAAEAELDVAGGDPWVSRAAHKLLAALEDFTGALIERGLPVPPALHTELQLHRDLWR